MGRPDEIQMVVDANVARAAGRGEPGANPPAPACISTLDLLQSGPFRAVFSRELLDEWDKHASLYAMKWVGNLRARKRYDRLDEPNWEGEEAMRDAAADLQGRGEYEVLKDAHIVCLAMVTGRRVLSLDSRQAQLLGRLVTAVPELTALHWASPTHDRTPDWLKEAAPDDASLCIEPVDG